MEKDFLLNLGRSPTMEELRDYFHENDFSAAKIMELDYETLPAETVEMLEEIKQLMNKPWEEYAQEMGMRSSDHYGKEHPLIALRNNTENLVSSTVFKLLDEHPESVEQILDQFDFTDPEIHQKADSFLNTAVKTTIQVMDYEKLLQVIRELPTYEDFNHNKHFNQPEIDFHRKWYHTRTKTQVVSLDAMQEATDEEGEPVETPGCRCFLLRAGKTPRIIPRRFRLRCIFHPTAADFEDQKLNRSKYIPKPCKAAKE